MSLRNDRKCYRWPRWRPMMIVLKTVSSQSSALLSQITKKNKDLTFILVYVMIHFCLQTSDHISFELKYRHGCCRNEGLWFTLVIIKQIIENATFVLTSSSFLKGFRKQLYLARKLICQDYKKKQPEKPWTLLFHVVIILRGKDVKKIVKLKVRWVYYFPSFVIFRPIIQVGDTKFGNYPYNEISFLKKTHF